MNAGVPSGSYWYTVVLFPTFPICWNGATGLRFALDFIAYYLSNSPAGFKLQTALQRYHKHAIFLDVIDDVTHRD